MFLSDEGRTERSLRGRDESICRGQGAASIFFVRKDELYNAVEFFLGVVEYLICREWWS